MSPKILGIPFDKKSSFQQGSALAPDVIREVLHNGSSNYWTESDIDISSMIKDADLGNLSVETYEDIYPELLSLVKAGEHYIFLGGDHSISYPLVKTIHEKNDQPFDVLLFDAHSDLYDVFEGDKYSHACPFARIMEDKLCERLIQVGIRSLTSHHKDQVNKFGVEMIQMRDIHLLKELQFNRPLYISIDLDGFDPAYAPGVSHHEPGGLNPRQVIDFLLSLNVPILSADIVELNPNRDVQQITAALAAKLLKELFGMILKSNSNLNKDL